MIQATEAEKQAQQRAEEERRAAIQRREHQQQQQQKAEEQRKRDMEQQQAAARLQTLQKTHQTPRVTPESHNKTAAAKNVAAIPAKPGFPPEVTLLLGARVHDNSPCR